MDRLSTKELVLDLLINATAMNQEPLMLCPVDLLSLGERRNKVNEGVERTVSRHCRQWHACRGMQAGIGGEQCKGETHCRVGKN